MTGEATSPGVGRWAPSAWRGFAAFLRRPELPERVTGIRLAAIGRVLQLVALDLVLMALLLLLVVVLLPMGEEMVFRSWLSGRPGHMIALVVLAVGVAIPVISGPQAHPVLLLGSLAIAVLLAIVVAVWLRKRRAMPFFARHFAWFYFASALLFAAAHLMNYSDGITLALLPLVVPQLIAGLIFGYARVSFGLWSDMMLHMMHNGLLVGLIVLTKGMT